MATAALLVVAGFSWFKLYTLHAALEQTESGGPIGLQLRDLSIGFLERAVELTRRFESAADTGVDLAVAAPDLTPLLAEASAALGVEVRHLALVGSGEGILSSTSGLQPDAPTSAWLSDPGREPLFVRCDSGCELLVRIDLPNAPGRQLLYAILPERLDPSDPIETFDLLVVASGADQPRRLHEWSKDSVSGMVADLTSRIELGSSERWIGDRVFALEAYPLTSTNQAQPTFIVYGSEVTRSRALRSAIWAFVLLGITSTLAALLLLLYLLGSMTSPARRRGRRGQFQRC